MPSSYPTLLDRIPKRPLHSRLDPLPLRLLLLAHSDPLGLDEHAAHARDREQGARQRVRRSGLGRLIRPHPRPAPALNRAVQHALERIGVRRILELDDLVPQANLLWPGMVNRAGVARTQTHRIRLFLQSNSEHRPEGRCYWA